VEETLVSSREKKMLQRFALALSSATLVVAVACSQSDAGVTTAVKSKLAADDTVKAYQLDVDTADRVVTLSGTVATPAEKQQAVMIARQTDGVRDVVDRITIGPAATATTGDIRDDANEAAREIQQEGREAGREIQQEGREAAREGRQEAREAGAVIEDAAITSAVKSKFLADTAVSGLKIDVDTKDGIVTLSGMVATRAEADRAAAIARDTNGVTRVVNNLRIGR
jgi:osmotically-inducible protein OsmY